LTQPQYTSQTHDLSNELNGVQQFFLNNLLSKINIYKIKNQQNIKMIGKKLNWNKLRWPINYQPNISDEIRKKKGEEQLKKQMQL